MEFILFGDVGQHVVGKQVGAVLRSHLTAEEMRYRYTLLRLCVQNTLAYQYDEKKLPRP